MTETAHCPDNWAFHAHLGSLSRSVASTRRSSASLMCAAFRGQDTIHSSTRKPCWNVTGFWSLSPLMVVVLAVAFVILISFRRHCEMCL